MKKGIIFVVALCVLSVITLMFVSCSGEVHGNKSNEDGKYIVITNLKDDGSYSSRAIGGLDNAPEIVGVLLKFHNEGLYQRNSSFFKDEYDPSSNSFSNNNAFYLEYFEETKQTHYGMEFNYALYVPDSIQKAYEDGNGNNPNSGNPFWWYMSCYYGNSIDYIRNNWEPILEFLLEHKDGLVKPNAEDVAGHWKAENEDEIADNKHSHDVATWYYDPEKEQYVSPDCILYFPDGQRISSEDEETKKVFIPSEVRFAYFSGSGEDDFFEAFLWYMEAYYDYDSETVIEAFENDNLGVLLEGKEYITPKGTDVPCVKRTNLVSCEYVDSDSQYTPSIEHFYVSDILVLDDGTIIQDRERIYYSISDGHISFYLPQGFMEDYKDNFSSFNYNGGWTSHYVKKYYPSLDIGYMLTGDAVNRLLDYRVSEGFPKDN